MLSALGAALPEAACRQGGAGPRRPRPPCPLGLLVETARRTALAALAAAAIAATLIATAGPVSAKVPPFVVEVSDPTPTVGEPVEVIVRIETDEDPWRRWEQMAPMWAPPVSLYRAEAVSAAGLSEPPVHEEIDFRSHGGGVYIAQLTIDSPGDYRLVSLGFVTSSPGSPGPVSITARSPTTAPVERSASVATGDLAAATHATVGDTDRTRRRTDWMLVLAAFAAGAVGLLGLLTRRLAGGRPARNSLRKLASESKHWEEVASRHR